MTMNFKLPATGLPKNVAVGDAVAFKIRPIKDGMFEITTIAPTTAAPHQDMKDKAMDGAMKGEMKMPAKPAGAAK
jgi:Cu(I)/Ag(I) efflux system membrane fusion protein